MGTPNPNTLEDKNLVRNLREILHHLSASENPVRWYKDEAKVYFYRGIVMTAMTVIMAVNQTDFYEAMMILDFMLPLDCIDLSYIFPTGWVDVLFQGKIAQAYCMTCHMDIKNGLSTWITRI